MVISIEPRPWTVSGDEHVSLKETIFAQMTEAMRQKDTVRLDALRMLRAAIKNREIELREDLDDQEVVRLVGIQIKQRKEAIGQYQAGGRDDLAKKEEQELAVLAAFVPAQLSEAETRELVNAVIQELGAKDMKDMGQVMKTAIARAAGSADGKVVNQLVRERLGS